jgi:hypothetical protein
LVDTRHPAFVRVTVEDGNGWSPDEYAPGSTERWRWTHGDAALLLDNPHDYPLAIDCTLDGWSVVERTARLVRSGGETRPVVLVRPTRGVVRFPVLGIPPGPTRLLLQSPQPPTIVPGDSRPLGISVFRFTVIPRE